METVITIYEKMRLNKKGNFTNPELFTENGGHISRKQRKQYDYIRKNNASFQEYFLKFYTQPFDNFARLTFDKCNYIIRYENISHDYKEALKRAGVKDPKPLPMANKTSGKKQDLEEYYTKDIQRRALFIFGPFLKKYNYTFPKRWQNKQIPHTAYILFHVIGFIRKWKWRFKKNSERKSIKGSIYGDIQREKEKNNVIN